MQNRLELGCSSNDRFGYAGLSRGTVVVTGTTTDEAEQVFADVVSWVQAASQVDRTAD